MNVIALTETPASTPTPIASATRPSSLAPRRARSLARATSERRGGIFIVAPGSVRECVTSWTPFCLSSGDSRGVDFLSPLRDEREDLSGEVALQGANGVELGMPFGESA